LIKRIFLAAIATVMLIAPNASWAQRSACGERSAIVERLSSKYGESRKSMGLNHNNGVVEVFASEETGTWTILLTMPSGQSCLIAAGQNWEGRPGDVEGAKSSI